MAIKEGLARDPLWVKKERPTSATSDVRRKECPTSPRPMSDVGFTFDVGRWTYRRRTS